MGYSTARRVAFEVLLRVYGRRAYSSIALDVAFTRNKLPLREKNLASELVYGTLRWQNRLDYIISHLSSRNIDDVELKILNILRLGVYQLLFLTNIPDRAAVKETTELAKLFGHKGKVSFINAILREFCRRREEVSLPGFDEDPFGYLVFTQSHPRWLVKRWVERWGMDETRRFIEANNKEAPLMLRMNASRINEDSLIKKLSEEGVEIVPSSHLPYSLIIKKGDPLNTRSFKDGLFYLQDEASQMIPFLLSPKKGERLLDACAAPGGKTVILAHLLGGGGMLVANDRHQGRIKLLRSNLERLRLSGVRVLASDVTAPPFNPCSFDQLLLDAPCSCLGRIRRAPEIKWLRSEEDIDKLFSLQLEMLLKTSELVKKGGRVIYSTCSVEPEETTDVVERFLDERRNFKLRDLRDGLDIKLTSFVNDDGFFLSFPHKHNTDAFFAALLEKTF
jgi:16S rRNA (cytosine967-C5)-methyltransferase